MPVASPPLAGKPGSYMQENKDGRKETAPLTMVDPGLRGGGKTLQITSQDRGDRASTPCLPCGANFLLVGKGTFQKVVGTGTIQFTTLAFYCHSPAHAKSHKGLQSVTNNQYRQGGAEWKGGYPL